MPAAERTSTRPARRAGRSTRFLPWLTRRFIGLPAARKLLVTEAVLGLALARLALFFVPFRVLAARFGAVTPGSAPPEPPAVLTPEQKETASAVGWAVTRAAQYVPFRAVCLPQAIAAKAMLSRRAVPSVMRFGVAKKADEPLAAHAWLDSGGIEVTGYPVAQDFIEVARFL